MNPDVTNTMKRLRIDEGIRPLIATLWAHRYQTHKSCSGHSTKEAYVLLRGGDGWFEENAHNYGLNIQPNSECCTSQSLEFLDEIAQFGLDPKDYKDQSKVCNACGAGVNDYVIYRGFLQTPLS